MDRPASTSYCLNCGYAFTKQQSYCPDCGQKSEVRRLRFHEIGHDAIHYFTHADKGIFYLLKKMAVQPGLTAREYVEGKRKKYFKPLNFFLIVAGVVVFMTSAFHSVDDSRSRQTRMAAERESNPERKNYFLKIADRTQQVSNFTAKYSNFINMAATPMLTVFLWLGYLRGRYNYVEHLVANMYFVGFIMLFYALLIVPFMYFSSNKMSLIWIGCFFIFEIIYRGNAYYHFINKKGIGPALKAYGLSVFLTIIWASLTSFLIMTYIRTGFR